MTFKKNIDKDLLTEYEEEFGAVEIPKLAAPKKEPKSIRVANWMRAAHDIVFNTVTGRLTEGKEGEPINMYDLILEACEYFNEDIAEVHVNIAAYASTVHTRVDPFREYFDSLPKWDGIDHIGNLAKHIKIKGDRTFFDKMFEKHLIRSVACSYDSTENRFVFTFVSEEQEIGKSSLIRFLNPFQNQYYCDETITDHKDSSVALCRNFIYNLEELEELTPRELAKLKSVISKRDVSVRLPYAHQEVTLKRRCNFWASTNKQGFLVDTKNTRFLCFDIESIDYRGYMKTVNIHDVWAQAFALYKQGDFDLTQEEKIERDRSNEGYRFESEEQQIILELFKPCPKGEGEFFTNAKIKKIMENTYPKARLNWYKISRELASIGFCRDVVRIEGVAQRGVWAFQHGVTMGDIGF